MRIETALAEPTRYSSLETLPESFQTVEDWWRENEPRSIELLADPALTFFADAERLQTICEERDIPFFWVPAPQSLRAKGLTEARAYPTWLLSEFYPINP